MRVGIFSTIASFALCLICSVEAVPGNALFVTGEDYVGMNPVPLGPDFTIEAWLFVTEANTAVFGEASSVDALKAVLLKTSCFFPRRACFLISAAHQADLPGYTSALGVLK